MAPKKVIIDTDPGVDDVLAILLALASPELEVVGITITFGNTAAESAYHNLLKIYAQLGREVDEDPEALKRYPGLQDDKKKTILALGADKPIDGKRSTAAYFHGEDGLSNISITHPHFTPPPIAEGEAHRHLDISSNPAHEVILDILQAEEEGSVTIIALGPLSNLALALRQDSKAFARVGEVVWMGGALDVPGNTTPSAEFNSFADPYAAQEILDGAEANLFRIAMAPLDITTPHTIDFAHLIHDPETAADKQATPLREFTSAMLGRVRELMASFGLEDAMEMHDPVAVWYAISGGEKGWSTQERVFKVERVGEWTRGMCVVDRRGTGEEGVLRTNGSASDGKSIQSKATPTAKKGYPRVIATTPGKEVLQRVLLGRVFGMRV